MPKIIPPEVKSRIIDLLLQGKYQKDVPKILDVSVSTVKRVKLEWYKGLSEHEKMIAERKIKKREGGGFAAFQIACQKDAEKIEYEKKRKLTEMIRKKTLESDIHMLECKKLILEFQVKHYYNIIAGSNMLDQSGKESPTDAKEVAITTEKVDVFEDRFRSVSQKIFASNSLMKKEQTSRTASLVHGTTTSPVAKAEVSESDLIDYYAKHPFFQVRDRPIQELTGRGSDPDTSSIKSPVTEAEKVTDNMQKRDNN